MIHEKISMRCEGSQEYAALETYLISDSREIPVEKRPLVIVCPGGGYHFTSEREGEMVALQFAARGYHAAVLWYSFAPSVFPTANLELGKAILTARRHAEEWHVDPDKIVVLGFSAGGHMVASYCMFWRKGGMAEKLGCGSEELRPNGLMLGYPVITSGEYANQGSIKNLLGAQYEDPEMRERMSLEKQVSSDVPRTFLWHTFEDTCVPIQNSLYLFQALVEHGIPAEYHVFEKGPHGLSLANKNTDDRNHTMQEPACATWIDLADKWLERTV